MKTIKRERSILGLTLKPLALSVALLSASAVATPAMAANTLEEAITGGKAFVNLRLRYEIADQEDFLGDSADALTLRTAFGYQTGEYNGFSVLVEAEDVREVLGVRDFTAPFNRVVDHDVIADPETTELDQAFVQYKSGGFTSKLGRQVITYDGHRFVGHVGWRQDRQTFDGITANYKTGGLELSGAYVTQRNRIFAEAADIDSEDIFLNASYKFGSGKLAAYGYLLDADGPGGEIDTYGISYAGKTKLGSTAINYNAEYAVQDNGSIDTDYFNFGVGAKFGPIKLSAGYEVLGSDDGFGEFTTPLATLHKFNGWADVFIFGAGGLGIEDLSLTLDAEVGGGKFKLAYHDFSSNEGDFVTGSDDLGDEIDIQYTRKLAKNLSGGIKYAIYSEGSAVTGVPIITDTDRGWVWLNYKFK